MVSVFLPIRRELLSVVVRGLATGVVMSGAEAFAQGRRRIPEYRNTVSALYRKIPTPSLFYCSFGMPIATPFHGITGVVRCRYPSFTVTLVMVMNDEVRTTAKNRF